MKTIEFRIKNKFEVDGVKMKTWHFIYGNLKPELYRYTNKLVYFAILDEFAITQKWNMISDLRNIK